MRRVGAAGGVPPDVPPPGAGPTGAADGGRLPSGNGSVQPVQTANVAPPGEIVIAGQGVPVPRPHRTNLLTLTVRVTAGSAGVSVPASAGDTLTAWFGSLATETDQLTAPPDACSETSEPVGPGTTIIVPPPGSTESVPSVGGGGGGGGGGGLALVGAGVGLAVVGAGAGVGLAVLAVDDGLAVVGAGDGLAVVGAGLSDARAAEAGGGGDGFRSVGLTVAGLTVPGVPDVAAAGLAAAEAGGGATGAEPGGLGLADGAKCSSRPVRANATAAMATATTTAAAIAACPRGEERSARTPPATPCCPARPACAGRGNPCLPKAPARLSTAVLCAAAP